MRLTQKIWREVAKPRNRREETGETWRRQEKASLREPPQGGGSVWLTLALSGDTGQAGLDWSHVTHPGILAGLALQLGSLKPTSWPPLSSRG